MADTHCLAEPLTAPELRMLQAYAEGDATTVASLDPWPLQPLADRGYVRRTKRGVLVTPEGLAALLDVVPAAIMRTASPVADLAAETPDAATRQSTAERTSVGSSSRRRPKPN
jgi:hypothetical protein